jgi:hypothetical protein
VKGFVALCLRSPVHEHQRKNKTGVRSYTFNYSAQGVECYIKTFLAQLIDGSSVMLNLALGTTLEVNEIIWEKLTLSGYQPLGTIASLSGLQFSYIDESPAQGANTYRATIKLNDGTLIYTEPQVVYYSNNSDYIIYPDPASQSEVINIISKEVNDAIMNIYNSRGELVMQKPLDDILVTIPAGKLSKGFYLIHVINSVENNAFLKLVVY